MNWKVEPVPHLKGYTVEWAEMGNFYLSRRNRLFRSATLDPPFETAAFIDAPLWKRAASRSRLAQRLLRFMVTNVIPLATGDIFVTFDRSAGIVRKGTYQALAGLVRPCRVLRSACAIDRKESIFFGEYLSNTDRGEMRVYKFPAGGDHLEVVYTFPAGSIRHIHGIYHDPFTDSLFCLTGDNENECRILQTFDEFRTLNVIGEGDETWRAVSVQFSEDSIFYGTDAEFRSNNIYQYDRRSGIRKNLGEVNGTVFYSKQINGDFFFATTAENAPSQKENAAGIWNVSNGTCREIAKFKKDRWNPTLFMFGTIHFPYANRGIDELYFSVVGAAGDNQTYRICRQ